MCGRARCSLSREEIRAETRVSRWRDEEAYAPSYNVSPSRSTPVVKQSDAGGEREIHTMKWGLIPSYTKVGEKHDFFRMFNARSETVAQKGVFKKLLGRQRCVVYLNGFYEWKKEGKQKQPYFVFQDGRTAMRMAGLFDVWRGSGDQPMYSFTILTTDSSEKLQWLHDRMPVVLPDQSAEDLWLSGEADNMVEQLAKLCHPYNGEDLQWFPVDPAMGSMKNDGPECCQPMKRKSIATFFKPKAESVANPSMSKMEEQLENKRSPDQEPVQDKPLLNSDETPKSKEVKEESTDASEAGPGRVKIEERESLIKSESSSQQPGLNQPQDALRQAPGSSERKRPAPNTPNLAASPVTKKAKAAPAVSDKGRITSFFSKRPQR